MSDRIETLNAEDVAEQILADQARRPIERALYGISQFEGAYIDRNTEHEYPITIGFRILKPEKNGTPESLHITGFGFYRLDTEFFYKLGDWREKVQSDPNLTTIIAPHDQKAILPVRVRVKDILDSIEHRRPNAFHAAIDAKYAAKSARFAYFAHFTTLFLGLRLQKSVKTHPTYRTDTFKQNFVSIFVSPAQFENLTHTAEERAGREYPPVFTRYQNGIIPQAVILQTVGDIKSGREALQAIRAAILVVAEKDQPYDLTFEADLLLQAFHPKENLASVREERDAYVFAEILNGDILYREKKGL
jgi:hypothetical protein